ncbi:MAG: hypothetical protein HQL08_15120 [Nitrospirae bacterium]|nr:hypothetical protein [Nitrospirota bacterium]
MDLNPYWKEEEGISILADGYLGFVFDSKYLGSSEPDYASISSYQTIHNEFVDSAIVAVKTNIRLEYKGNWFKTFLWPSYVRGRMNKIYEDAFEKVRHLKQQMTDAPELMSAIQVSSIVATKKYFLYITARKNGVCELKGKMDFSYARCGDKESVLINTDNVVTDMSICYNLGFWPVVLPVKAFQKQARFLSLPLGADPIFLGGMGLFTGNIDNA